MSGAQPSGPGKPADLLRFRYDEAIPYGHTPPSKEPGTLCRHQRPLVAPQGPRHPFRFHAPHVHLAPVFGSDWFGIKAEAFARFVGTPTFRSPRP